MTPYMASVHIQSMDERESKFLGALQVWADSALHLADKVEACRVAHARSVVGAEGDKLTRRAIADIATSELRLARNKCRAEERAHYHRMIFLRGSAGESRTGGA